ncbi:polysaccharide pyruvyl transferase family protein [Gramella sp. BOM4]|nr:polysaccharide pyruvyl transferase family protein [Christiangramia bathymodioli]
MKNLNYIPLFWWSEVYLMGKSKENYGDLLSKYIVEKISGKNAKWVHPKKQAWYKLNKTNFLSTGSILAHATMHSVVWGSGIVDRKHHVNQADFRAVRGPETRSFLLNLGYKCPEIYGDTAILLPDYFSPKVQKKFELGIIPHYVDYKTIKDKYGKYENIKVIDLMTLDVEKTTTEILSCRRIVSSSLHGLIVPHAYGIPAIWIQFSNKVFGDNIKYEDYYQSVQMEEYKNPDNGLNLTDDSHVEDLFQKYESLPDPKLISELKIGLKNSCPFLNNKNHSSV